MFFPCVSTMIAASDLSYCGTLGKYRPGQAFMRFAWKPISCRSESRLAIEDRRVRPPPWATVGLIGGRCIVPLNPLGPKHHSFCKFSQVEQVLMSWFQERKDNVHRVRVWNLDMKVKWQETWVAIVMYIVSCFMRNTCSRKISECWNGIGTLRTTLLTPM